MIHNDVRRRLEEAEERLSPYAARSRRSKGRQQPEEPSPVRTEFQRDRDRIVHSLAFRRLKHKTQVFITPLDDYFVTRLTHTIEVAQIARTIARALNLNEDLTEAIALGHDLGHTPFGHQGEEALFELLPGGFRHNEQSLRVVDLLDKEGRGLNLTWEVREGILKHSKARSDLFVNAAGLPSTLEGQIVMLADSIAYINHDLTDALRAGLFAAEEVPAASLDVLGHSHSERINTLVCDVIECSWAATGEGSGQPTIAMSPRVAQAANELRDFLFQRVYLVERDETRQAKEMTRCLFQHFVAHREELPPEYLLRDETPERRAADFVASMTDRSAQAIFQKLQGCAKLE